MMRKFSWVLLVFSLFSCVPRPAVEVSDIHQTDVVSDIGFFLNEQKPSSVITWEKDGARMVLIPEKRVGLDGFYMDANEVTVGQFKKFIKQSEYEFYYWYKVAKYSPADDYPMVFVNWNEATAYAKWAGKRLPTGWEWEWAARGGLVNKKYPWGDDESLARDYANYQGTGGKDMWDEWDEQTAPVGSFKPNGYGLFDMVGNVGEWCQDRAGWDKKYRMIRGGDARNPIHFLWVTRRTDYNAPPTSRARYSGFRCVADLP